MPPKVAMSHKDEEATQPQQRFKDPSESFADLIKRYGIFGIPPELYEPLRGTPSLHESSDAETEENQRTPMVLQDPSSSSYRSPSKSLQPTFPTERYT